MVPEALEDVADPMLGLWPEPPALTDAEGLDFQPFDFFFSFDHEEGVERAMACFEGEEAETLVRPMGGAQLWLAIARKELPETSKLLFEWEGWAKVVAAGSDGSLIAREKVTDEWLPRTRPHTGIVAAMMMLDDRNPMAAVEELEPLLSDDPDGRIGSMLALARVRSGETAAAIPLLERLLATRTGNFSRATCWNLLGECLVANDQPIPAEQAFVEALRERPFHAGTLYNLARQKMAAGDGEAAFDLLDGAILRNRFLKRKALLDGAFEPLRDAVRFFELLGE
jgi:tetratricopeptide (TPR) repeat protein